MKKILMTTTILIELSAPAFAVDKDAEAGCKAKYEDTSPGLETGARKRLAACNRALEAQPVEDDARAGLWLHRAHARVFSVPCTMWPFYSTPPLSKCEDAYSLAIIDMKKA